ncbi:MAG: methyltransferase domain-containing protein [Desulfocapsaceae bacterium]
MNDYVHGYSTYETERLDDQAQVLRRFLHEEVRFTAGARVLEAGCGTGAQTVILAANNPSAHFISVDLAEDSLTEAASAISAHGFSNVSLEQQNIYELRYPENHFDHIFCCFVLEHLPDPDQALLKLKRVLKPGGTITVIEGDHGSFFCHPPSENISAAVDCLVELQRQKGGDALIGRRLFPLLSAAGFESLQVSPRTIYADDSKPEIVSGFSKKTFVAMVAGIRDAAIKQDLISTQQWHQAMEDFNRAVGSEGTFCYTFFKAVGTKMG